MQKAKIKNYVEGFVHDSLKNIQVPVFLDMQQDKPLPSILFYIRQISFLKTIPSSYEVDFNISIFSNDRRKTTRYLTKIFELINADIFLFDEVCDVQLPHATSSMKYQVLYLKHSFIVCDYDYNINSSETKIEYRLCIIPVQKL